MEKEKERQEILKKFKGKLRATKTRLATQSSALAKNEEETKAIDEAQKNAKTAAS